MEAHRDSERSASGKALVKMTLVARGISSGVAKSVLFLTSLISLGPKSPQSDNLELLPG